ncbi:hypothetical protein VTN02DRAFT_3148 [Thermoascus thermophilus]
MALRTSAVNAEDVAAGLRQFRDPLPEHSTEITGMIADLYAISTALNSLEELTSSRHYRHNLHLVQPDLDLVQASLKYTLEDVVDFFGDLDSRRTLTRDVYKQTWIDLSTFFNNEIHYSLATRLGKYKLFLKELEDIMKNKSPDVAFLSGLRSNIRALLVAQDSRFAAQLGSMSLGPPPAGPPGRDCAFESDIVEPGSPVLGGRGPRMRRSYERPRPPALSVSSPQSSQTSHSPSSGTFSDIPPYVPDVPVSPATNSTSTTTESCDPRAPNDHWAKRVFANEYTATIIPMAGPSSKCFGDLIPGVRRWLDREGFEELSQLTFNGGPESISVHFYVRETDHRARIMCRVPHVSRPSDYYCLPLNMLEIVREGPCLQLCRKRRAGTELVLWANLKFNTIERMVLFFCTFLALRSQDCGRPVHRIRDYELHDEEELFGGQIVDDGYLHALRVYRDTISGALRLQASVHSGEMKRSPVWTAFITHHLTNRSWLRRVDSKTIHFRELQRTIFISDDYTPPRGPRGEHVLTFTTRAEADSFLNTLRMFR